MIRPTKYTHLKLSLINVSAYIANELRINSSLTYDELLERTKIAVDRNIKFVFVDSLNFLYVLGILEYDSNSDAFYYCNHLSEDEVSPNEII